MAALQRWSGMVNEDITYLIMVLWNITQKLKIEKLGIDFSLAQCRPYNSDLFCMFGIY
jgi:hypothetical protein